MLTHRLWAQRVYALAQTCRCAPVLGAAAVLASACGAADGAVRRPSTQPHASLSEAAARGHRSPDAGAATASDSHVARAVEALAGRATLPELLEVALARNPELAGARERARAARELAPAASRLADPEFEYQLWAQPLGRPHALGEAQMHMFGLRQTFPAPGTLRAEAQAALGEAGVAEHWRRAAVQDLTLRVRRAYAEYYQADRQLQIHLEHAQLSEQMVDAARAAYQGGRGTQRDVLRAGLELTRLQDTISSIAAARRSARGLLNALMARDPEAPLGPPAPIEPSSVQLRLDRLERLLTDQNPEVAAARVAVTVRESELDSARSRARWPSFMVGVQYMYMPPESQRHNYGVMLSMSLPWLNPSHDEKVRAAEASVSAEKHALSSARLAARYESYEAMQRLMAARESLAILERDLLPQARRHFESARAAYRGGEPDSLAMLEALRSLLDIRLERERALVRTDVALAELERAIGVPVSSPHDDGGRAR